MEFKQTLKHTGLYSIAGFLPTASKFLLFPLFVRNLSPTDYGILGLSGAISVVLSVVFPLGLESAFSRFYFDFRRNENLNNKFFSSTFLIILFLIFVFYLLAHFFGNSIILLMTNEGLINWETFGQLTFGITALSVLNALFLLYYRNEQNVKFFLIVSVGSFLSALLPETISVLLLNGNAIDVLQARFGGLCFFSILFYIYRSPILVSGFSFRFFRRPAIYALPLVPYALAGVIFLSIDRFIVEYQLGSYHLGIYNTAATIATILDILTISIQNSALPQVFSRWKSIEKKDQGAHSSIFRQMVGLHMLAMVFILAMCPLFYRYIATPEYYEALHIVSILLAGTICRMLYIIYTTPLFFAKKTKFIPFLNIIPVLAALMFVYFFDLKEIRDIAYLMIEVKLLQLALVFVIVKFENQLIIPLKRVLPVSIFFLLYLCFLPLLVDLNMSFDVQVLYYAPFLISVVLICYCTLTTGFRGLLRYID